MRRPSARRFPRRLPRGGPGASCPAGTAPAPPPVGRSVVVFLMLALTASCVHVDPSPTASERRPPSPPRTTLARPSPVEALSAPVRRKTGDHARPAGKSHRPERTSGSAGTDDGPQPQPRNRADRPRSTASTPPRSQAAPPPRHRAAPPAPPRPRQRAAPAAPRRPAAKPRPRTRLRPRVTVHPRELCRWGTQAGVRRDLMALCRQTYGR